MAGEEVSGDASPDTAPQAAWDLPPPEPEPEPEEIELPDLNRQAMVLCLGLMSNKGWSAERRLMVLYDYLMARQLYTDFTNYIKKMR